MTESISNTIKERDKMKKFQKMTSFDSDDVDRGFVYLLVNEKAWRNIPGKNFTFKLGKTTNLVNGISDCDDEEYMRIFHLSFCGRNLSKIEEDISKEFKNKFMWERVFLGDEYFTGCVHDAQKIVLDIITQYGDYELQKDLINNVWLGKDISSYKKISHEDHLILFKSDNEIIFHNCSDNKTKKDKISDELFDKPHEDLTKLKNEFVEQTDKSYKTKWYGENIERVSKYNKQKYLEKKEALKNKATSSYLEKNSQ